MKHQITHGSTRFFYDLPMYFIERYEPELTAWRENFREIGPVKSIVIREGYFSELSPNDELGAELIQVKLIGKICQMGVEVSPYRDRDEACIMRHCERMSRFGVASNAVLKEPERSWLPFMPTKVWDPPKL